MMDGDLHLTKLDDQQAYLTNNTNTYLGKKMAWLIDCSISRNHLKLGNYWQ